MRCLAYLSIWLLRLPLVILEGIFGEWWVVQPLFEIIGMLGLVLSPVGHMLVDVFRLRTRETPRRKVETSPRETGPTVARLTPTNTSIWA